MTLNLSLLMLRKRFFELFLEIVKSIHDQTCHFEKAMQRMAEVIVKHIQEEGEEEIHDERKN